MYTRILVESHFFLYYGGNNDTQRLLCNRIGYDTCMKNNIDYQYFIINLNIRDCDGFE